MIEVCGLIDTDTSLYNPDGSLNKSQAKRDETKEKLQDLKDAYENLKTNSDPIYAGEFDEMVYEYLKELRYKFSEKSIKEMSRDELAEMYEILVAIDETLADARKLIGWGDAETVYEAGTGLLSARILAYSSLDFMAFLGITFPVSGSYLPTHSLTVFFLPSTILDVLVYA